MREIWKPIKQDGLPSHYQISDHGRIRSLPYVDRRGWKRKLYYHKYTDAQLLLRCIDGKSRSFSVGALVLKTFIGPPGKGQYLARHLNDDRTNNNVSNLAWGNDANNHADALKNGANFISYGHLGKKHSETTKQILREQRLGKSTGRKITSEHKAALLAGYRKKFPEKQL